MFLGDGRFLLSVIFLLLISSCSFSSSASGVHRICPDGQAMVSGYAQAFIGGAALVDGKIQVITANTPPRTVTTTDKRGGFRFCWPIKQRITLQFIKAGYATTESPLLKVPEQGLQGPFHEVTFQVPRKFSYRVLEYLLKVQRLVGIDPKACQIATTVTAYHKTLQDDPQGLAGANIRISHLGRLVYLNTHPYYFGIFLSKTFPFSFYRKFTSEDGGVVVFNLPTSKKPYTITAVKLGEHFSHERFICRPGAFINLSPPHGPMQLIDSMN